MMVLCKEIIHWHLSESFYPQLCSPLLSAPWSHHHSFRMDYIFAFTNLPCFFIFLLSIHWSESPESHWTTLIYNWISESFAFLKNSLLFIPAIIPIYSYTFLFLYGSFVLVIYPCRSLEVRQLFYGNWLCCVAFLQESILRNAWNKNEFFAIVWKQYNGAIICLLSRVPQRSFATFDNKINENGTASTCRTQRTSS